VLEIYKDTLCSHHKTKVSSQNLKSITFNLKKGLMCHGAMYYLSKRALNIIVSKFSYHNFNICSTDLFEDYTFANILKDFL
jgi:hypothetical protein